MEIQNLVDDNKSGFDMKKQDSQVELEEKRRLFEDVLKLQAEELGKTGDAHTGSQGLACVYVDLNVSDVPNMTPRLPLLNADARLIPPRNNKLYSQFWRRSPNWIWADSDQSSIDDSDTHFWPVKVDNSNTIALRNAGNNNYCARLSTEGKTDMLNADVHNITKQARLVVQELVSQRNIYNVVYRMQDARIYDEMPYIAGSSVLTNSSDQEAAMAVQITYQDEKSYTFSRSLSLTAGVETTFSTGVPFILDGEITVSFEINTTLQWDTVKTNTTSVMASGSIPVPVRSTAVIEYVGTKGTCDVPYSYTQQDKSSTDGSVSYTEQVDGIYKGISFYNFHFVVKSVQALF
ncbi:uncharacterized protein LOC125206488 [Salvia hispanica]|uniref:uncharacterized protein LOC125206488 n=1 Tax=Salvia hispanica TaxID=49212 RepID=UPI0020094357|nr:uncharacterized protein LOC125206488 [Salvia hispanica]